MTLTSIEEADALMRYAEALYKKNGPIIRPADRMLVEERMDW